MEKLWPVREDGSHLFGLIKVWYKSIQVDKLDGQVCVLKVSSAYGRLGIRAHLQMMCTWWYQWPILWSFVYDVARMCMEDLDIVPWYPWHASWTLMWHNDDFCMNSMEMWILRTMKTWWSCFAHGTLDVGTHIHDGMLHMIAWCIWLISLKARAMMSAWWSPLFSWHILEIWFLGYDAPIHGHILGWDALMPLA